MPNSIEIPLEFIEGIGIVRRTPPFYYAHAPFLEGFNVITNFLFQTYT